MKFCVAIVTMRQRAATLMKKITATVLLALMASGAGAQSYPVKPVRLIVPFPPGGGTDALARTVAQNLTATFGHAVIVDNRAGAGGTIGAEMGVRAAPDGYTLVMVSGSYAANAALLNLPYDPVADITQVALIAEAGFIIALHPGVAAKSLKELIALTATQPGKLNYASTGTGGITHLTTEYFLLATGARMTHIPYKGTGPSTVDLLSGQVQMKISAVPSMVQHMTTGRVRGIAITTLTRNALLPDVPTVAESFPGFQAKSWYGVWGPRGLPQPVVMRWNREIARIVQTPAMQDRMAAEGLDAVIAPPERLRDQLREEVPKWARVVKAANIQPIQ